MPVRVAVGIAALHPSYEIAVIASEAKQSISQHQERMDCSLRSQ
jgi:hypothetical protein